MAYFIEVAGRDVRYPAVCSVCAGDGPLFVGERSIEQVSGFYVVAYTTKTTTVTVPVCARCLNRGKRRLWLVVAFLFLPWAPIFVGRLFFSDLVAFAEFAAVVFPYSLLCCVGGVFGLTFAGSATTHCELIYANDRELVFSSKSREYAEALAAANGTKVIEAVAYVRGV